MRAVAGDTLELIHRHQAGDADAFAGIFHANKNLVYRTAYLMLGNARDAEDVLQEVFFQVHHALHQFDPARAAFATWLYRITINACLSWRRKWRLLTLSLDAIEPATHDAAAPDDDVVNAVAKLSAKLRAVVVLRYYADLSYAEVAETLNVPVGTVKSRLNQALQVIREDLLAAEAREARLARAT